MQPRAAKMVPIRSNNVSSELHQRRTSPRFQCSESHLPNPSTSASSGMYESAFTPVLQPNSRDSNAGTEVRTAYPCFCFAVIESM